MIFDHFIHKSLPKNLKLQKYPKLWGFSQKYKIFRYTTLGQKYKIFRNTKIQKLFLDRQARKNYFWTAKPEKTFLDRQVRKSIFGLPSPIKKFGPPSPKNSFLDSQVRKKLDRQVWDFWKFYLEDPIYTWKTSNQIRNNLIHISKTFNNMKKTPLTQIWKTPTKSGKHLFTSGKIYFYKICMSIAKSFLHR